MKASPLFAVVAVAVVAVVGASAVARAAPDAVVVEDGRATLPSGLVLEVRGDSELVVRRDKLAVVVYREPTWRGQCPDGNSPKAGSCGMSLEHVVLHADGTIDVDLDWGGEATFRKGELEARLDVATAAKQRGPAAITTLEHALATDPRSWEATRDLAVRQLADHHADRAAETVAALLRLDLLPSYHRLILEPRLRAVLAQPAIAALRAPAGTHPPKARALDGAWSATLKAVVVAIHERVKTTVHAGWDESDPLVLFQPLAADQSALTLPAGETASIDRLVRDFGFQADPAAEVAEASSDDGDDILTFAHAGLSVHVEQMGVDPATNQYVRKDESVRVLRDDTLIARDADCRPMTLTSGTFLPAASVLVIKDSETSVAGVDHVCVIAVPR